MNKINITYLEKLLWLLYELQGRGTAMRSQFKIIYIVASYMLDAICIIQLEELSHF